MYCYQCEQTAGGEGCASHGVCGKTPEASDLQDLLIQMTMGLSQYAQAARKLGAPRDTEIDAFMMDALFTTVTNVNFDPKSLARLVKRAAALRNKERERYESVAKANGAEPTPLDGPAAIVLEKDYPALLKQATGFSIHDEITRDGEDATGLRQLILFGLKGVAAYACHARILGHENQDVYDFFHETLDFLAHAPTDINALLGKALEVGKVNFEVMGLLDAANTGAYGHPVPTTVRVTPVKGKAILVSGHDLKDLEDILKQTEGKGINVYTHGEMLPCHGYPELKKYAHLVGNYGGAWQDQRQEFDAFPGAILMTTNCIQKPKDSYHDRIFTTGLVQWPDVTHIDDHDFTPVIKAAQAAEGFLDDVSEKTITIGFGHEAVMSVAATVIEAVKAGKIRHFFLIGGCDGAKSGRNYYTKLAESVPDDCVILTLACGKYRFNKLDLGDIGGVPRLLDIGQCNDAYSAIKIASALAEAFNTDVNGLPLSMILSWYEQKAVCILLTLLYLGVRDIRLGPSLPAFVTPAALSILTEKFNIMPISTPEEDLKAILG